MTEKISIELEKDEALILFDFLGRFNQMEIENIFEDNAERMVLCNVEAVLETVIDEVFAPNYKEIISHARKRISVEE